MYYLFILAAALFPVGFMLLQIRYADSARPEPVPLLWRAFGFGVLSVFVSLSFTFFFFGILGFGVNDDATGLFASLYRAFFGAGLPEETAKLMMLYLCVRNVREFDEHMDGIVYAVCVSMGFAAFENVSYLISAGDDWLEVGIMRGLMSIPGHYFFGVFMGYWFSKWWWEPDSRPGSLFWMLAAPVFAHTLYDFLLMWMTGSPEWFQCALMVMLLFSCWRFMVWSRRHIAEHLDTDRQWGDWHYDKRER